MDTLPLEIVSHIISYVDLRWQLRLSAVSTRWREAVADCLRRRKRLMWRGTNDTLRALLPRMPALRVLSVGPLRLGDLLDIDIVSENCPLLEEVSLTPFRLDADSLERLCRRCPRLRDLSLKTSTDLLELLLRRLPGLRSLAVYNTHVSAAAVALLPAGLERLKLSQCKLTVLPRQPADQWPRLTKLSLIPIHDDTDDSPYGVTAALVAGCPRLVRLRSFLWEVDDLALALLPGAHLQHLDISFRRLPTEGGLSRCFRRLRQLRTLDISGVPNVTDSVLDALACAESLTELTLGEEGNHVFGESPSLFTMDAVDRLIVTTHTLELVTLYSKDRYELNMLVADLAFHLDPDRNVTLIINNELVWDVRIDVELSLDSGPLRLEGYYP